jgi:hypothetical protein
MASDTHPRGKLTKDDEGALNIAVGSHGATVVVDFGKSVHWIGLDPTTAKSLAASIIKHAEDVEARHGS